MLRVVIGLSCLWFVSVTTAGVAAETPATAAKDASGEKLAWGNETSGMVAHLRALQTVVKRGEPIEFEIRVKNVSNGIVHVLSGREEETMSPCTWSFRFGQWDWSSAALSVRGVPLKPGETASVRCLVATTPENLTVEQRRRFFVAAFRHAKSKQKVDRLPAGRYRVSAASWMFNSRDHLETNTVEVRVVKR